MCGIVGYVGTKKACPVLIDGLFSLEYRGYDSAGLAVMNNHSVDVFKAQGRVFNLSNLIKDKLIDGCVGIAHTRWATRGVPSDKNAHPHADNFNEFYVVHNGIIENYDYLKSFLSDNGYHLVSDTDTEVIPNLVHYFYRSQNLPILQAFSSALKMLVGSYAIEMISPLFDNTIFIAKKDSPIVVGMSDDGNYISSDIPAISKYTNNFYIINDLEIGVLTPSSAEFYDLELNPVDKIISAVDCDEVSYSKNGFEDFMLKEIFDQPHALDNTISSASFDMLSNIDFSKFNKIYIVACGTAMHAGLASQFSFEQFTKINTVVDTSSEFRYRNPLVDEKTLCVFITQSGETADTIAALNLAKSKLATTIAIVNAPQSSITRLADFVLYTRAGTEIAVASTKAYTSQVALLIMLSMYIGEKLNVLDFEKANELKHELSLIPSKVQSILSGIETIVNIAKDMYNEHDIFFIGRLLDYAVAMEGSLKLKEISYIHSEAYSAGELKHGPIALVEAGSNVICVATNKEIFAKTLNNLEEVATRGAKITLVTTSSCKDEIVENSSISHLVVIPDCQDVLSPILSVIPLQLLAYYIAKLKNVDVDKPRNLAKSVTVE